MKPILAALLLSVAAFAQAPQPPAPAQNPDLPKMTEVQSANFDRDMAKIETAQTRAKADSAQWISDAQRVVAEVEKANPGWTWHEAQNPQDRTGWMRKPPPTPPTPPIPQAKPAERPPYPTAAQAPVVPPPAHPPAPTTPAKK